MARHPWVAGVDGCRAGWVVATVPARDEPQAVEVEVVPSLREVRGRIEAGRLAAAAVDIPIGLASDQPRRADIEARARLGPRRSSVFPAPVRAVLPARTYQEACDLSRAASGKAIGKQLYNILPKIVEADDLVTAELQDRIFEMHPEVSFSELRGGPMRFPKRTADGRAERITALSRAFPAVDPASVASPRGAQADDVLDALVGAWTARRKFAGAHRQLGGDLDETGLRMEMIV